MPEWKSGFMRIIIEETPLRKMVFGQITIMTPKRVASLAGVEWSLLGVRIATGEFPRLGATDSGGGARALRFRTLLAVAT